MTNPSEPSSWAAIRARVLAEMASLPQSIGRYVVRGELGRGGMGVVYDAFDPRLDRDVAVKVLRRSRLPGESTPDFRQRFEREMRATSRIFHPNLVSILDAGVESYGGSGDDEAHPYYVMERVESASLEERLEEQGVLARAPGLRIAAAIARGLAAVHTHGLVHGDLKPSNVLLPSNGEPKLTDFGLCCAERERLGDLGASHILGSAHYVSPEQVRGEDVDARADLFALGCILIRMFLGEEPFQAPSLPAHLSRILHDEPDGLDRLDDDVRHLVTRLVAKRPEGRPAGAEQVAAELEQMAAAPGDPATEAVAQAAAGPRLRLRGASACSSGWPPAHSAPAWSWRRAPCCCATSSWVSTTRRPPAGSRWRTSSRASTSCSRSWWG